MSISMKCTFCSLYIGLASVYFVISFPYTTVDPFAQLEKRDEVAENNDNREIIKQDAYDYYGVKANLSGENHFESSTSPTINSFTSFTTDTYETGLNEEILATNSAQSGLIDLSDSKLSMNSINSTEPTKHRFVISTIEENTSALSNDNGSSLSSSNRNGASNNFGRRKITNGKNSNRRGRGRGSMPFNQAVKPSKPYERSTADLMKFLQRFGYLQEGGNNTEALFKEEAVDEAVRQMQAFAGIAPTGKVDAETLELLVTPRCGNKDLTTNQVTGTRLKRYILGPSGWSKRNISYFVANWTPKLQSEDKVKSILKKAFEAWAGYARLTFVETYSTEADIVILFGNGYHGDYYPFDGPGFTLAHAYYPYEFGHLGGDVHFDEAEPWAINPEDYNSGVDFFTVAVHEIGHSLGLSHSPVTSSIMYPYYKGHQKNFQLGYDDILAMYQLYIARSLPDDVPVSTSTTLTARTTTTTTIKTSTTTEAATTPVATTIRVYDDVTEISYDGDYDTVDQHKKKTQQVTTESFIATNPTMKSTVEITTKGTIPNICEGSYDAVSVLRGELFLFKGGYVWRLRSRNQLEPGYPVPFYQMFFLLPTDIRTVDAVYERKRDSALVFFSGQNYWVSDGNHLTVEKNPITDFGLPAGIRKLDAALVWPKNGKLYLFSKNLYWRYDDTKGLMDEGYPKELSRWRGVPSDLDAAFSYTDGKTYFLKKELQWRFNDTIVKIDSNSPEKAPQYWLPC
ncbi:matrix metalloproteinase-2-like [Artemia franciscana]|uniref:Peptidase metallopeptidase domain-containing protein n=1 Tax=Artemia franciscana TaxID=6661 RepID=A0AA88KUI1_ARTSF|nr:hypothetical protein QYM36_018709 [Artemia franciscana]